MGEAKRRGTYEERKALAKARWANIQRELAQRRPSPKLKASRSAMAAMILANMQARGVKKPE